MTKAATKTVKRARRGPPPAAAITRRLPTLAMPVTRAVRRDPLRLAMAASGTCQACVDACDRLPVSLQAACKNVCAAVCKI